MFQSSTTRRTARRLAAAAAAALALSLASAGGTRAAVGMRPCDIYASAGTPCVAAHSTTRALFAAYAGPLYQVTRLADGAMRDVPTLGPGGVADATAQDAFCRGSRCVITRIYDQTPEHNDLTIEGGGGAAHAPDRGAFAGMLPVVVEGRRAYGVFIAAGMGYRDDQTRGVASGGRPETMYMVTSGTHVNGRCCFDYGNAETSNDDTGNGHMDALNFSTSCGRRRCSGPGPWPQADLENGLYMSARGGTADPAYTGSPFPFVTALLKNDGQTFFALRAGNAQQGPLETTYHGGLPRGKPGYIPMQTEGAIVLGTGGDNSNRSIGSFFEGAMTAGVTPPAADQAVQADIVAAGYRNGSM